MYRYIVRQSCSQFDSLPLSYLTPLDGGRGGVRRSPARGHREPATTPGRPSALPCVAGGASAAAERRAPAPRVVPAVRAAPSLAVAALVDAERVDGLGENSESAGNNTEVRSSPTSSTTKIADTPWCVLRHLGSTRCPGSAAVFIAYSPSPQCDDALALAGTPHFCERSSSTARTAIGRTSVLALRSRRRSLQSLRAQRSSLEGAAPSAAWVSASRDSSSRATPKPSLSSSSSRRLRST